MGEAHESCDVDRDHRTLFVQFRLDKSPAIAKACIVDQDVDGCPASLYGVQHFFDSVGSGKIGNCGRDSDRLFMLLLEQLQAGFITPRQEKTESPCSGDFRELPARLS